MASLFKFMRSRNASGDEATHVVDQDQVIDEKHTNKLAGDTEDASSLKSGDVVPVSDPDASPGGLTFEEGEPFFARCIQCCMIIHCAHRCGRRNGPPPRRFHLHASHVSPHVTLQQTCSISLFLG